jgi:hypothetical protein
MTVCELIEAARKFEPTNEDIAQLMKRAAAFEKEIAAKGWKPGEYHAWLNKPFSSL